LTSRSDHDDVTDFAEGARMLGNGSSSSLTVFPTGLLAIPLTRPP